LSDGGFIANLDVAHSICEWRGVPSC